MKNRLYIFLLTILAAACMPEEDLPIRNVGEVPEYFIECYCTPGLPFALAATNIIPVAGELKIDYLRPVSVTVHAGRDLKLEYRIFSLPGSGFIYNYGSDEYLDPSGLDSLFLTVCTEDGLRITGATAIPAPVRIYDYTLKDNEANIRFYPSSRPGENYYIYSVEIFNRDTLTEQAVSYMDYSDLPASAGLQNKSLMIPGLQKSDKIILTLKRITKANYDYQISLNAANTANQSSITTPVPLKGNLRHALGIFTCFTSDQAELFPPFTKK